jgi:hypothetical protein
VVDAGGGNVEGRTVVEGTAVVVVAVEGDSVVVVAVEGGGAWGAVVVCVGAGTRVT